MAQQETLQGVLLEAEQFSDWGGWVLDASYERDMGSAYLMAHGLGKPVEDAQTTFTIPESDAGEVTVWVRAKDWVPNHHPGRFQVLIDGETLPETLGANGKDWYWQEAGTVRLNAGEHKVQLHDLTGFDGRCDALFITPVGIKPPAGESGLSVDRAWRHSLLGLPSCPVDVGTFDLVVVGGGVPAAAAAIAGARTGSSVAVICDRPVFGGNASSEVGLGPRGFKTPLVEALIARNDDMSLGCEEMVASEENVATFMNTRAFACEKDGANIYSIDARNLISGKEIRIFGKQFVDATGRGELAKLADAQIRTGREGKDEFGESLAPDTPDDLHHGHTLLYHVGMADAPVNWTDMEWASEVAGDYACLAGQMGRLSEDNQPGPCTGEPTTPEEAKAAGDEAQKKLLAYVQSNHMFPPEEVIHLFPGTHFWEYGQYLDWDEPGTEELVRDHLMCALYGTMANVKAAMPEKYANLCFEWLHHVPATGEYCRIMGDTIVTENDVREHKSFPDTVVYNSEPFCLHYPGDPDHDFRLGSWVFDMYDGRPYEIPFSSLYSKNVDNLMMAGKQISVSRVVGASTKVMANGGQHGVAVGCAASIANKYGKTPREVGKDHLDELRSSIEKISQS